MPLGSTYSVRLKVLGPPVNDEPHEGFTTALLTETNKTKNKIMIDYKKSIEENWNRDCGQQFLVPTVVVEILYEYKMEVETKTQTIVLNFNL